MSAADTSAGKPYQIIGAPVHENRWDDQAQQVVGGWVVRARWNANGSLIPVFVPDGADLASTADERIRFYGAQLDALHAG